MHRPRIKIARSPERCKDVGRVKLSIAVAALLTIGAAQPKLDADTAAWWRTTAQLSNDSMEGRDTGSAAYLRAA
jgi:hypothetical protein